jgi:choline/glycine/proline betaine transport protein
MVVIFFVTSADSGALVLNMLSARGEDDTPALQRMIWTGIIALTAIVLLLAGGLAALQTASIATALPYSIALLVAIWGFAKALQMDAAKREVVAVQPHVTDTRDWRKRLRNLVQYADDEQVHGFLEGVVLPALRDFGQELGNCGMSYRVCDEVSARGSARLEVLNGDDVEFSYEVRNREHPVAQDNHASDALAALAEDDKFHRAEVHLAEGGQDYCIMGWTREQVAMDVLNQYSQHVQFVQSMR